MEGPDDVVTPVREISGIRFKHLCWVNYKSVNGMILPLRHDEEGLVRIFASTADD